MHFSESYSSLQETEQMRTSNKTEKRFQHKIPSDVPERYCRLPIYLLRAISADAMIALWCDTTYLDLEKKERGITGTPHSGARGHGSLTGLSNRPNNQTDLLLFLTKPSTIHMTVNKPA